MASPIVLMGGKVAVYVDGSDLGQDGRAGHPAITRDTVDAVTFKDTAHRNKASLGGVFSFDYTGLFTSTVGRSYTVLNDMWGSGTGNPTPQVLTYWPDSATVTAPGIGLGSAFVTNITNVGGPGDLEEISVTITQDGTFDDLTGIAPNNTVTANFTGTAVDLLSSSTAGGRFYINILDNKAVGGSAQWVLTVEHSTNSTGNFVTATGATGTYGTGTAIGTILVSSGDLRQYVRLIGTKDATTGTFQYVAGAKRS